MTDYGPRESVPLQALKPAPFKATYILRPDLKVLVNNIERNGLIYGILAHVDGYIVDGHARWLALQQLGVDEVAVQWVRGTEAEMMLLHVELNRGGSNVVAKDLSKLIKRLIRSGYDEEEIRDRLNMTIDEYEVLAEGELIKRKKMAEYKYNKAWVPVETKGQGEAFQIERPKTPDR